MKKYVASHLKDMNRLVVYQLFAQNEEIFRGEISKRTGISAPTVLKIVDFMIENNLVLELGEGESAIGRKPHMLVLNPDAMYTVGIIFEGAFVRAGIMNFRREILHHVTVSATADFHKDAKKLIPEIITDLIETTGIQVEKLAGIGIGVPGPYDNEKNTVIYAPLVGIHEAENMDWLLEWLYSTYGVQIVMGNDVNMCVIGEYNTLNLNNDDLIYINIGTGLGAGMILDGNLRAGRNYQCGEIGYMSFLNENEYEAVRKNPGWLESKINIGGLQHLFKFNIMEKTTKNVSEIIDYVADKLALCIGNIIAIVDCCNIVVGGMLLDALGEGLIEAINTKLQKLSVSEISVTAAKSVDAGTRGACCETMDQVVKTLLMQ